MMAAEDSALQGGRVSAAIVLTRLSQNRVSVSEGLHSAACNTDILVFPVGEHQQPSMFQCYRILGNANIFIFSTHEMFRIIMVS